VYLKYKGGLKWLVSGIPAAFMAIMTIWAVILNQTTFLHKHNMLLTVVNIAILIVVLWIVIEGIIKFFTIGGEPAGEPEVASG